MICKPLCLDTYEFMVNTACTVDRHLLITTSSAHGGDVPHPSASLGNSRRDNQSLLHNSQTLIADGTALVELVESLLRICTNIFTTAALHAVSYPMNAVFPHRVLASSRLSMRSPRGRPPPFVPPRARGSVSTSISKVRTCRAFADMSVVFLSQIPAQCRFDLLHAYLGHLVSVLPLRADAPGHSCDSKHNTHDDSRVRLPVLRLSVPTTGGRPDVLRVPVVAKPSAIKSHHTRVQDCYTYGTLAPPPMRTCVGFIVAVMRYCVGICQSPGCVVEVRLEVRARGGDGFVCASDWQVSCA